MTTVAFRIPDEMKQQMDRVDINWSDYVRHAISEALHSEEKRDLLRKLQGYPRGSGKVPAGTAVSILRGIREHA